MKDCDNCDIEEFCGYSVDTLGCERFADIVKKHDAKVRADAIDEFIRFIFGRNIIHNRKFTTREEEYFLNMAEQFKEQLKEQNENYDK